MWKTCSSKLPRKSTKIFKTESETTFILFRLMAESACVSVCAYGAMYIHCCMPYKMQGCVMIPCVFPLSPSLPPSLPCVVVST